MPFDFLDALNFISELLNSGSSGLGFEKKHRKSKKSKNTTELWSGSFLLTASVLYFLVFEGALPEENYVQSLLICVLIGFIISFIIFFTLYHLEAYYFKSLFSLLLFSCSVILLTISAVLFTYFRSGIFI